MGAIFQSLGRTLVAGLVILVAILAAAGTFEKMGTHQWAAFFMRYLHVLSGMMWVGLLYYFNFVQIPSMAKIPDEQKPAVSKVIAPAALFWFRWAAVATVATGLLLSMMGRSFRSLFTFEPPYTAIAIGMWIALVMAFNVWFIIWPNQKKALGIVAVDADARAKAARTAMLTSRFNTMLSIPMLYCMVAQQNNGL